MMDTIADVGRGDARRGWRRAPATDVAVSEATDHRGELCARRIRCRGGAPLWSERQYAVHLATARTADVNDVGKTVSIVPVRVVEVTPMATATAPASMGRMEIVLVGGERILVGADVDATALARIVKALGRR